MQTESQCKKKIDMQRSGINTITSHIPPSIPKGKGYTQNLTNAHERHVQLIEGTATFQTGGDSATLTENGSNINF